jgi:hypothetical protein
MGWYIEKGSATVPCLLTCLHCLGHERTAVIISRCMFFFIIKAGRYCWGYPYFLIVSLQCKTVGWYGVVAPFQTSPGAHTTQGKTPGEWR